MRRLGSIRKLFIFLLAFTIFGLATSRAESREQRAEEATQKLASAAPSDFVGSSACIACHKEVTGKYSSNPHFRHDHDGKAVSCESCHGPGRKHIESGGDTEKIFSFNGAKTAEEDNICLGCHAASLPDFKHTAHREAGVGCVGCHSMHAFKSEKTMLKQPETTLCETCHADVKPAFELRSHHKVNEGVMTCGDCHNPHAPVDKQSPAAVANQNQICMNCHIDAAGPFVYEHPPVRTEGCISCHAPHGSENPRLLTKSNGNELCTQCHTAMPNYTAPGTKPFHNQATQSQACTTCHARIHGSNTSSFFSR
uniref:Putative multiheme cytochrome c n=1 Tax=mine drainage metagenome TaxID=410659 RepID=E6QIJ4_9ZZZZ